MKEWNRKKLIKEYIEFFKSKNHKEIPNAALIPENDPTVLFTTAGMHPLVPFLLGQPHPLGKRLCNVQKCLRTQDIDEVGDEYHHTFFEMLGNWSLGDYWKKEAISWSYEFLTRILKIPKEKIAISCFAGDEEVPRDEESARIWKSLGIPKERIIFLDREHNWWGPAGKTGPCGPDTEMFVWVGKGKPTGNPKTHEKEWREIWNDVFMEYNKKEDGTYTQLQQKNVDTGMGVERTLAILNNLDDDYLTDCFWPIIMEIEKISKKEYGKNNANTKAMRIIADHLKAAVFILAEKIEPSNKEHGYVLRRLIRRAIRYGKLIDINENFTKKIAEKVLEIYDDYEHLHKNKEFIFSSLEKEEKKFRQTLQKGLNYFEKITKEKKFLSGEEAFLLYQSYGFPLEIIQELAREKKIEVDIEGFEKEFEKHKELSRTATEGKFKSGLADHSEETTKLHTATHLLHSALRKILGDKVRQAGSNITSERLRFDFTFDRKLTEDEIKKVEELVNKMIQKNLKVKREEMPLQKALDSGALSFFRQKYPSIVSVYTIYDEKTGEVFSKEICTGPHVKNTSELGRGGKKFKIIKEESVAAGVRRIKAVLE